MKTILSIVSIGVCVFFFSCVSKRYVYAADPIQNPILTKKNEAIIDVNVNTNRIIPGENHFAHGINTTLAYSIAKNWVLLYANSWKIEKDINIHIQSLWVTYSNNYFDSSNTLYKRNSNLFAVGYFLPFSKNKNSNYFNVYAGYSIGTFNINDKGSNAGALFFRNYKAKNSFYFIQPAYNYLDNNIKFTVGCRLLLNTYSNINTNYTNEELTFFDFKDLNNRSSILLEPFFNFGVFFKEIPWLSASAGASTSINFAKYTIRQNQLNFGLQVNPVSLFKTIK